METRAHHLLIGGFVLLVVAAIFAFTIWVAKFQIDTEFTEYDIFFDESVAGLAIGGDVQFNGIPVGTVRRISVAPHDPSKVWVLIRIIADTPVREDSLAVLEIQGLTGVTYVQIEGGEADSPKLLPDNGEDRAVLDNYRSLLGELYKGFPDLLQQTAKVVVRLQTVLGDENQRALTGILQNIETITGGIAEQSDELGQVIVEFNRALKSINAAAVSIEAVAASSDAFVQEDLAALLAEATRAAETATALGDQLTLMVEENRGSISSFSNSTLPEISRMVLDIRRLTRNLSRLAEQIGDDPTEAIFGSKRPTFEKE